ncbi:Os01g0511800, partial [Oryza sativa Japonica Group]
ATTALEPLPATPPRRRISLTCHRRRVLLLPTHRHCIASSPSPPRRPPSHSPLLHCLLHTASALSSSSPTAVASSSSPSPAIARHCLADLLSQRHHQSRGGHHPRVPFAGSTVVVRSADGVNSATVVQLSIPNTCRAVLSTAAASASPSPTASSFASPISSLRAAINLATATVAAMQPSSSDPPPLPQRRLCRPVRQHLRTLRRLIFLRVLLRKLLFSCCCYTCCVERKLCQKLNIVVNVLGQSFFRHYSLQPTDDEIVMAPCYLHQLIN